MAAAESFPAPLNESPSEKEGKFFLVPVSGDQRVHPSMKVPPKRKGNTGAPTTAQMTALPSMKVPPKRKGNLHALVFSRNMSNPQ